VIRKKEITIAMSLSKPKVFVSSTIYDFRDLRSALKLWLEEYGYEVLLSEFNDFPQLPDQNLYESCLKAIGQSDYFLLFIGSRVGTWYNQDQQLSVTRMEYRHAYEQFKQGKLKILVFVRKEIWDIHQDRKELKRFLENEASLQTELSLEDKTKIVNHPSNFLNDANFIMDFLHEVTRSEEMNEASKRALELPSGNWIYQFTSFHDIIDAARTVLNLSGDLRQKALCSNLKHEIKSILAELLQPDDNGVQPVTSWSKFARKRFQGNWNDKSSYKGDYLIWLGMFLLTDGNVGKRMKVTALREAISSGEFLDFDKTTGMHTVGPLQGALIELDAHIEQLRNIDNSHVLNTAIMLLSNDDIKNNRGKEFVMPNEKLVMAFAIHDLIENVMILCHAIYFALEGNESHLGNVKLNPSSPIKDESEKIRRERVSFDNVHNWLETA
jgi:hypothetical protein